jgi:hypothetical protein
MVRQGVVFQSVREDSLYLWRLKNRCWARSGHSERMSPRFRQEYKLVVLPARDPAQVCTFGDM